MGLYRFELLSPADGAAADTPNQMAFPKANLHDMTCVLGVVCCACAVPGLRRLHDHLSVCIPGMQHVVRCKGKNAQRLDGMSIMYSACPGSCQPCATAFPWLEVLRRGVRLLQCGAPTKTSWRTQPDQCGRGPCGFRGKAPGLAPYWENIPLERCGAWPRLCSGLFRSMLCIQRPRCHGLSLSKCLGQLWGRRLSGARPRRSRGQWLGARHGRGPSRGGDCWQTSTCQPRRWGGSCSQKRVLVETSR